MNQKKMVNANDKLEEKGKEHTHLERHIYTAQKESGVGEWGVVVNEKQAQVCVQWVKRVMQLWIIPLSPT
jgi:hypothetical protein